MSEVSRPAKDFTPKQGLYLAYIYAYTRLHRRPPAEIDLREYVRVSPPSVHQMLVGWSGQGSSGGNRGSPAASSCSSIQNTYQTCFEPTSTAENH
jgi:hypothetical protein